MHKEAVSYVLLVVNILVISIHFDDAEKSSTTCHQQMLCFPTLFTKKFCYNLFKPDFLPKKIKQV